MNAFGDSDSEIRVLTVKDGEGRELREAKFVEILKEARHRIRSATIRGAKESYKLHYSCFRLRDVRFCLVH